MLTSVNFVSEAIALIALQDIPNKHRCEILRLITTIHESRKWLQQLPFNKNIYMKENRQFPVTCLQIAVKLEQNHILLCILYGRTCHMMW